MKKLLTIVVCGQPNDDRVLSSFEEIDYIYTENNEADLTDALKRAKGRYTALLPPTFSVSDVKPALTVLTETDDDVVSFECCSAIKTQLFKGLNFGDNNCCFLFTVFAACGAKTIHRTRYCPFIHNRAYEVFNENFDEILLKACAEFKRVKAKLDKEVYNFVFDMLVSKLMEFYMRAMLAARYGSYDAEKIAEFDNKLKGEIVLYMAVENRFSSSKMQKFRKRRFKISALQAKKIKKDLITKDA